MFIPVWTSRSAPWPLTPDLHLIWFTSADHEAAPTGSGSTPALPPQRKGVVALCSRRQARLIPSQRSSFVVGILMLPWAQLRGTHARTRARCSNQRFCGRFCKTPAFPAPGWYVLIRTSRNKPEQPASSCACSNLLPSSPSAAFIWRTSTFSRFLWLFLCKSLSGKFWVWTLAVDAFFSFSEYWSFSATVSSSAWWRVFCSCRSVTDDQCDSTSCSPLWTLCVCFSWLLYDFHTFSFSLYLLYW